MNLRAIASTASLATVLAAAPFAAPPDPWPGWRGPDGTGVSTDADVPIEWSVDRNVLWKTPVGGRGYSSPVIWGDRVFLTTAYEGETVPGAEPPPHLLGGEPFVHPDSEAGDKRHRMVVMAFDARTGEELWARTAYDGPVYDARHRAGSYANTTPATDGMLVFTWFGSEGLYAYDFDGRLVWSYDLGDIAAFGMGTGSSPVLYRNLLILQCDDDNGEKSFIVAVDTRTGKEVWRTPRGVQAGWSTPVIARAESGREELVASGNEWVIGYDPATGQELWRARGTGVWTVASPIAAHGIVVASGSHVEKRAVAIRLGGSGDVTETHVVWERNRGTAYTPSAIAYGDYAYMLTDGGLMSCIDMRTGEVRYEGGRPTTSSRVWSSLVAFRDRLFLSNEDGETYVIPAGPSFAIERVNQLDAPIYASLAPADGRLYIRTTTHLYAIAESSPRP